MNVLPSTTRFIANEQTYVYEFYVYRLPAFRCLFDFLSFWL